MDFSNMFSSPALNTSMQSLTPSSGFSSPSLGSAIGGANLGSSFGSTPQFDFGQLMGLTQNQMQPMPQVSGDQNWMQKIGVQDKEGAFNYDNIGNVVKGLGGLGSLALTGLNYGETKRANKSAQEVARETLDMQRKMNAMNAAGQQRYMDYKGWGSEGSKNRYDQLVSDLTNTALA